MHEPEALLQVVFDKHKGFGLQPIRPLRVIAFMPEPQVELIAMLRICEAEHGFKPLPGNYHPLVPQMYSRPPTTGLIARRPNR